MIPEIKLVNVVLKANPTPIEIPQRISPTCNPTILNPINKEKTSNT